MKHIQVSFEWLFRWLMWDRAGAIESNPHVKIRNEIDVSQYNNYNLNLRYLVWSKFAVDEGAAPRQCLWAKDGGSGFTQAGGESADIEKRELEPEVPVKEIADKIIDLIHRSNPHVNNSRDDVYCQCRGGSIKPI